MNNKGHIFILDVVISIIILLIGIALVFYAFPTKNKVYYATERLSEDVVSVLATTPVNKLCSNLDSDSQCRCNEHYQKLEVLVCEDSINNRDTTILVLLTEGLEKKVFTSEQIRDVIKEIFVENKVIDEKRFGFAILYTAEGGLGGGEPLELYNSGNAGGSS